MPTLFDHSWIPIGLQLKSGLIVAPVVATLAAVIALYIYIYILGDGLLRVRARMRNAQ